MVEPLEDAAQRPAVEAARRRRLGEGPTARRREAIDEDLVDDRVAQPRPGRARRRRGRRSLPRRADRPQVGRRSRDTRRRRLGDARAAARRATTPGDLGRPRLVPTARRPGLDPVADERAVRLARDRSRPSLAIAPQQGVPGDLGPVERDGRPDRGHAPARRPGRAVGREVARDVVGADDGGPTRHADRDRLARAAGRAARGRGRGARPRPPPAAGQAAARPSRACRRRSRRRRRPVRPAWRRPSARRSAHGPPESGRGRVQMATPPAALRQRQMAARRRGPRAAEQLRRTRSRRRSPRAPTGERTGRAGSRAAGDDDDRPARRPCRAGTRGSRRRSRGPGSRRPGAPGDATPVAGRAARTNARWSRSQAAASHGIVRRVLALPSSPSSPTSSPYRIDGTPT